MKLGDRKDVIVRLRYLMNFPNEPYEIEIVNTGKIVRNQAELVREVVMQDLLRAKWYERKV